MRDMEGSDLRAIRGRLLSFVAEPAGPGDRDSYRYIEDGIVVVRDGRVAAVGEAADLAATLPEGTPVDHHPDGLIVPGFIDTHIHFPQTQVIASYGAQLLDWLNKYTFVEEQRFVDAGHAERNAAFFMDELLRNGTTTAVVYATVHPASVEAFFAEFGSTRDRHDRGQGHDGPQRSAGAARHAADQL